MRALVRVFDGHDVRTLLIKGEPWFVAKDVCDVLGIANSRDALGRLEDDEKGVATTDTPGGKQEVLILNESGLYALTFSSRKEDAKLFRKWVTSEVLPSIRKTGKYAITQAERAESIAARNGLTLQWLEHGADKPYHYINLTRVSYKALFGTVQKKKEAMTAKEISMLRALEAVEQARLMSSPGVQGYQELAESISETGRLLPAFISGNLFPRRTA